MYAIYQNKVFIEKKKYVYTVILHDFLKCCRNLSCCRIKRKDLVPLKYKVINVMLPDEIFVIFFNMEFTYIEYFIECLQT